MKINIQSPGFTPNLQLINFVTSEINKLPGIYHQIIGSDVCLRLDSSASGDNKICSIRLHIPGNDLLISTRYKNFEAAITQAVEKLKRQIKKHKTKITGRKKILANPLRAGICNPK